MKFKKKINTYYKGFVGESKVHIANTLFIQSVDFHSRMSTFLTLKLFLSPPHSKFEVDPEYMTPCLKQINNL